MTSCSTEESSKETPALGTWDWEGPGRATHDDGPRGRSPASTSLSTPLQVAPETPAAARTAQGSSQFRLGLVCSQKLACVFPLRPLHHFTEGF